MARENQAQNIKDTNTYVQQINSGKFTIEKGYALNRTQKIIRHVINEVMCNFYVSWNEVAKLFDATPNEIQATIAYNENSLNDFAADGLLTFNAKEIVISDLGKYFIRNIAASLDPIMKNASQKFSKAL
jgi:oxygen-independent coproporphyrinogen-3 oxidase